MNVLFFVFLILFGGFSVIFFVGMSDVIVALDKIAENLLARTNTEIPPSADPKTKESL